MPPPTSVVAQSPEVHARVTYERVQLAIHDGDFKRALPLLEESLPHLANEPRARFLAGCAAFETGRYQKTLDYLYPLLESADEDLRQTRDYEEALRLTAEAEDLNVIRGPAQRFLEDWAGAWTVNRYRNGLWEQKSEAYHRYGIFEPVSADQVAISYAAQLAVPNHVKTASAQPDGSLEFRNTDEIFIKSTDDPETVGTKLESDLMQFTFNTPVTEFGTRLGVNARTFRHDASNATWETGYLNSEDEPYRIVIRNVSADSKEVQYFEADSTILFATDVSERFGPREEGDRKLLLETDVSSAEHAIAALVGYYSWDGTVPRDRERYSNLFWEDAEYYNYLQANADHCVGPLERAFDYVRRLWNSNETSSNSRQITTDVVTQEEIGDRLLALFHVRATFVSGRTTEQWRTAVFHRRGAEWRISLLGAPGQNSSQDQRERILSALRALLQHKAGNASEASEALAAARKKPQPGCGCLAEFVAKEMKTNQ